jgi:hypothetical protein
MPKLVNPYDTPGGGGWVKGLKVTSTLNMEAICSSETLVTTYKPTWRHNPEDTIQTEQHCVPLVYRICQHAIDTACIGHLVCLNSYKRAVYLELD